MEIKQWRWSVRKAKKCNSERHAQRCDIELKLSVRIPHFSGLEMNIMCRLKWFNLTIPTTSIFLIFLKGVYYNVVPMSQQSCKLICINVVYMHPILAYMSVLFVNRPFDANLMVNPIIVIKTAKDAHLEAGSAKDERRGRILLPT